MPPENDAPDAEETPVRLGSVERAILDLLIADLGPVPRSQVMRALYPTVWPARQADEEWAVGSTGATRRALVEATVSRAIGSLVRKGLILREPQRSTGRTILYAVGAQAPLPDWAKAARDEEDFAAHAAARAEHWRTLAARARRRALRLREERWVGSTDDERQTDMRMARQLSPDGRAVAAREVARPSGFSLSRSVRLIVRRRGAADAPPMRRGLTGG